jgi:uncharacterized protein involved in exopolysaccharide biosynthesis
MVDRREETADRGHTNSPGGGDLADEVERARTPLTPLFALAGVWLTIAIALAIVLALVALAIYLL